MGACVVWCGVVWYGMVWCGVVLRCYGGVVLRFRGCGKKKKKEEEEEGTSVAKLRGVR